jgi:hypothetical protein
MKRRSFLRLLGITGGLAAAPAARGAVISNVQFVDELFVSDLKLKLRGTGLYYYKLLIKVAAAALYLDQKATGTNVLADVPKRLEMQYFWSVATSDLVTGSSALLERNLDAETRERLDPQIQEMLTLYCDVAAGDRCAFMYLPGAGTSLLLNGKRLGIVPGAEFAAAFFSIWFGAKPLDAGLKSKLLGQT